MNRTGISSEVILRAQIARSSVSSRQSVAPTSPACGRYLTICGPGFFANLDICCTCTPPTVAANSSCDPKRIKWSGRASRWPLRRRAQRHWPEHNSRRSVPSTLEPAGINSCIFLFHNSLRDAEFYSNLMRSASKSRPLLRIAATLLVLVFVCGSAVFPAPPNRTAIITVITAITAT